MQGGREQQQHQQQNQQQQQQTVGSKRKRPNSIQVPERTAAAAAARGDGLTPKSPYEDSLAALHEIATSPSTFAPPASDAKPSRESDKDGNKRKGRPSLLIDVGGHQGAGSDEGSAPTSTGGLTSLGTPLSLLLGQGMDTPSLQVRRGTAACMARRAHGSFLCDQLGLPGLLAPSLQKTCNKVTS